ncbi:MAG: signal peptidase II [Actinomycetota bacterium]
MSPRRAPPWVFLFATAAISYALDRVTKLWAESRLAGRPPIVVIPHVLDLGYTTNSGGAFGLGESAWWIFALASIAVSVAIVVSAFRVRRVLNAVALGLILGGALGNLTDRVIHGDGFLRGHVVDFIDFHVWPVFNIADSCIVVGALLLGFFAARGEEA